MSYRIDKEPTYWGGLELREKLEQMEKKAKKMTKAEAFEWLKGKKIMCYAGIAYILDEPTMVEKFLLEIGCRYHFANHIGWRDWYWPLYGFIVNKTGEIYAAFENQRDFFAQDFSELISVDDILSIEIVEEKKKSEEEEALDKISCLGAQICDILRQMNGHYHVEITETSVNLFSEGMNLYYSDPF